MKRAFFTCFFLIFSGMVAADAAVISGIVSDSAGAPLKRIYVALRTTTTEAGTTLVRDTTDSSGAYSVTCDSTSGKYVLRSIDLNSLYFTQYDSLTLDGTDKTVAIKLALIKWSSISGTVTDSATNTAMAGVAVRVGTRSATTGADGKYGFDSVMTGAATISASIKGYVTKIVSVSVTESPITADIALAPVKYSSLSGTITDSATGTVIAGAEVRLGTTRRDTAGADGKYGFDSVATGPITITASAKGYVTKAVLDTLGDSALTVDVALALTEYGSLSGTVTDSATGTVIAGAEVRLGTTRRDTTGVDGKYGFDSVATGAVMISASSRGYAAKSISDTVGDSAQTADFKLAAIPYASLSGTVADSATGTAIAGAVVTLMPRNGFSATQTDTCGTDGTFSMDSIEFGTYFLIFSAVNYTARTDSVVLSDTASKTISVKLAATIFFAVSGKVVDSVTGAAIAGASVLLRSAMSTTLDSVVTDSSGRYTIDSAFAGTRIRVTATGYEVKRIQLTGATTEPQTIDVPLAKTPIAIKAKNSIHTERTVTIAADRLLLSNFKDAGTVRLLNMKGELMCVQSFPAGAMFCMKLAQRLPAGLYMLKISQKSGALLRRVVVR